MIGPCLNTFDYGFAHPYIKGEIVTAGNKKESDKEAEKKADSDTVSTFSTLHKDEFDEILKNYYVTLEAVAFRTGPSADAWVQIAKKKILKFVDKHPEFKNNEEYKRLKL